MNNNNTSHTDRFEELCSAYVLDALDTDEKEAFESELEEANQDELETYHELRATANQLAFTVERAEPPASVLERIMSQIRGDTSGASVTSAPTAKDSSKKSHGFSRATLAMAAAFALLLATLALAYFAFNQNATINNQEAQITELKTEIQQKDEMLSILEARTVDLVVMDGLDVNPNGYGKVIWDSEKQQALLQVSNLPKVPTGKDYQLWLIKNNKPTSAGVFAVNDPAKDSFFKVEEMAQANKQNANAFAITLEPKGGSQQPTGDMYMLGNVGQQTN